MGQKKARNEVGKWEVGQALPLGGVSQLDPTQVDPAIRVDLTKTLPVMESRKSMRRVHGTYFPTRPLLTWFLFWILLATSFLQSIQWQAETVLIQFSVHFGANRAGNVLAGFAYVIVLIFIFSLISAQVRFHLFWSLGVTVVFVVLQAALLIHRRGGSWRLQSSLLGGYLIIQLAGLACQAFAWRAFPRLQRKLWYLNKLELHGTKPLKRTASPGKDQVPTLTGAQASCSFKYVGPLSRLLPRFIRRHRTFHLSYMGEVDAEGRPHGYGEWMDTYFYGEELRGIWERGVPVGPFKARESGSGSAFVNLRIGYIQNRRDKPDQAHSTTPTAISYGVMAVECGTAGLFFRDYPQATSITGPLPVGRTPSPKNGSDPEAGPANPNDDVAVAIQNVLDNMPIAQQLRPGATVSTSPPAQDTLLSTSTPHQPASLSTSMPAQHTLPSTSPPPQHTSLSTSMPAQHKVPSVGPTHPALFHMAAPAQQSPGYPASERLPKGAQAEGAGPEGGGPASCVAAEAQLRVADKTRVWEHRGGSAVRLDAVPDGADSANRGDDMAAPEPSYRAAAPPLPLPIQEGLTDHAGKSNHAELLNEANLPNHTALPKERLLPNQAALPKEGRLSIQAQSPGPTAALVFIHGCNCSLADGCKSMGQFMALANLPPSVRPFVFSWPTGSLVNYLQAKVKGAEAEVTSEAFAGFVRGLGEVGFQELHVMTHSMGVRVLMAAIPQLETLYGVGAPPPEKGAHCPAKATPGIRLASVSLLNPDFELAEFKGGAGQRLRALCSLITLYGDRQDLALWGAAIFNGLHNAWKGLKQQGEEQPKCCAKARGFALERSVGRHVYSIVDPHGHPLDMDVVDTTFLDANVQDARHMSFNLNSSLVDDLREVVTFQRRAWERTSGLDARGANVYSFLVAPTYIKNK